MTVGYNTVKRTSEDSELCDLFGLVRVHYYTIIVSYSQLEVEYFAYAEKMAYFSCVTGSGAEYRSFAE